VDFLQEDMQNGMEKNGAMSVLELQERILVNPFLVIKTKDGAA